MSDQAAVAEPLLQTVPEQHTHAEQKAKRQPPYHVILWNDDDHSYEYVIQMLMDCSATLRKRGSCWPRRWIPRAE